MKFWIIYIGYSDGRNQAIRLYARKASDAIRLSIGDIDPRERARIQSYSIREANEPKTTGTEAVA